MAACELDGIAIECSGPCGLACSVGGCWAWCIEQVVKAAAPAQGEARAVPQVMVIRRGEAEARRPTDADQVKICTHELPHDGLVAGLEHMLGEKLAMTPAGDRKEGDISFEGTVADLLDSVGVARQAT